MLSYTAAAKFSSVIPAARIASTVKFSGMPGSAYAGIAAPAPSNVNAAVSNNAPARFKQIGFFIPSPLILFLFFCFRLSESISSPFQIPDESLS